MNKLISKQGQTELRELTSGYAVITTDPITIRTLASEGLGSGTQCISDLNDAETLYYLLAHCAVVAYIDEVQKHLSDWEQIYTNVVLSDELIDPNSAYYYISVKDLKRESPGLIVLPKTNRGTYQNRIALSHEMGHREFIDEEINLHKVNTPNKEIQKISELKAIETSFKHNIKDNSIPQWSFDIILKHLTMIFLTHGDEDSYYTAINTIREWSKKYNVKSISSYDKYKETGDFIDSIKDLDDETIARELSLWSDEDEEDEKNG